MKRLENFEDYLRKLNVEDTWPIHGTHCTIPKIHKPRKEEFTKKCMEPGLSSYGNLIRFGGKFNLVLNFSSPWITRSVREIENIGSIIVI